MNYALLNAREKTDAFEKKLLRQFDGKNLVTVRSNIPGIKKGCLESNYIVYKIFLECKKKLKPAAVFHSYTDEEGLIFFLIVKSDPVKIKRATVKIEETHPLGRLFSGKRPVFENGLFTMIIEGFVEILEVLSSYISNSVSFLRVGAFALSHAVLSFIIFTITDVLGGYLSFGILASIAGNLLIILLEGLIVSIQTIRLQYYEFFSKFFTETGKEFKPFRFTYKEM